MVNYRKRKFWTNKRIVILKTANACLFFFACCLFFFEYSNEIFADFKAFKLFPFVFFIGTLFVAAYVVILMGHFDRKSLYRADRLDWLYRLVFAITLFSIAFRVYFLPSSIDPSMVHGELIESGFGTMQVPTHIIIMGIVAFIIMLLTPRVRDCDNEDF